MYLGLIPISRLTEFRCGKEGGINCRIYNKSVEITKKGNKWIKEVWKKVGCEEEMGGVWRVGFQLKREVLTQVKVSLPDNFFNSLNSIWSHCPRKWFSLRVPNGNDKTKIRWPLVTWWSELSALEFAESSVEVVREIHKNTQDKNKDDNY